jgi:hypothetical protein
MRFSQPLVLFVGWFAAELGIELDLEALHSQPD